MTSLIASITPVQGLSPGQCASWRDCGAQLPLEGTEPFSWRETKRRLLHNPRGRVKSSNFRPTARKDLHILESTSRSAKRPFSPDHTTPASAQALPNAVLFFPTRKFVDVPSGIRRSRCMLALLSMRLRKLTALVKTFRQGSAAGWPPISSCSATETAACHHLPGRVQESDGRAFGHDSGNAVAHSETDE